MQTLVLIIPLYTNVNCSRQQTLPNVCILILIFAYSCHCSEVVNIVIIDGKPVALLMTQTLPSLVVQVQENSEVIP